MKKWIRRWGMILAGVMVLSSMTGCGNGDGAQTTPTPVPTKSVETPAPTEEPEESKYTVIKDANGNTVNLGGMHIEMRSWYGGPLGEPTNPYEEARLEWLDWAQETYNFTFVETTVGNYDSVSADFTDYANSTDDGNNYLFVLPTTSAIIAAIKNNLIFDVATLDCLDFTEEKWNDGITELFTFGNSTYAMFAADNEPRCGVYFNKRLLADVGITAEYLYDLQEKGEWTFDKCLEIMSKVHRDLDGDGIIDIYGTVNNNSNVYKAALFANGGRFIGKDADGKFTYCLEDENSMAGLNWAHNMLTTYTYPQPDGAAWDWFKAVFKNGDAAFCFDDAYMAGGDWTTMEDDFGYLCFPKGPQAEDYTNVYQNNLVVIPACYSAEKAWNLAFAYNIWTAPVPGFEDYEGWKPGYLKNFRDLESVDLTLARMVENGQVDYSAVISNLDTGSQFLWNLGWWTTPAAEAEKTRPVWASYLEEANK